VWLCAGPAFAGRQACSTTEFLQLNVAKKKVANEVLPGLKPTGVTIAGSLKKKSPKY
jgi:hypothetical protein